MEVYLKLYNRVTIVNSDKILLSDVANVNYDSNTLGNIVIKKINFSKHKIFTIDIIEIIDVIKKKKDLTIYNIGSDEILVEYFPKEKKENKLFNFIKLSLLTIILFGGAATTIMAFHNETGIPDIFDNYFKMFFGYESKNPAIIDIPYSIGLAVGIIGFFNHILGKSFSEEPTPIEIEMNKYNSDLNEAEKQILDGDKSD